MQWSRYFEDYSAVGRHQCSLIWKPAACMQQQQPCRYKLPWQLLLNNGQLATSNKKAGESSVPCQTLLNMMAVITPDDGHSRWAWSPPQRVATVCNQHCTCCCASCWRPTFCWRCCCSERRDASRRCCSARRSALACFICRQPEWIFVSMHHTLATQSSAAAQSALQHQLPDAGAQHQDLLSRPVSQHSAFEHNPTSRPDHPLADKTMLQAVTTNSQMQRDASKVARAKATESWTFLPQRLWVSVVYLAVQAGLLIPQGLLPLLSSFLCLEKGCLPLLQTRAHRDSSFEGISAAQVRQAGRSNDMPDREAAQQWLIAQNAGLGNSDI